MGTDGPAARRAQERFGQIQATLIEVSHILAAQSALSPQEAFIQVTKGRDWSDEEFRAVSMTDWTPELTKARNDMVMCQRCREVFANEYDCLWHKCQIAEEQRQDAERQERVLRQVERRQSNFDDYGGIDEDDH